jgi:hypothetical protein
MSSPDSDATQAAQAHAQTLGQTQDGNGALLNASSCSKASAKVDDAGRINTGSLFIDQPDADVRSQESI